MKRFLSIVLSVVMVMSTMSFGVLADDEPTPGAIMSDGSFKTWDELVEDGDVTITLFEGRNWLSKKASSDIKEIVIDGDAVDVLGGAFGESTTIEKVVIGEGVEAIGNKALYVGPKLQSKLTEIVIPESVKSIGFGAFANTAITSATVYADKTYEARNIETNPQVSTFSTCKNLKTVVIEDGVKTIGHKMFEECYDLETVVIPASVTKIEYRAFYNCAKLKNVLILSPDFEIEGQVFHKNNRAIEGFSNLNVYVLNQAMKDKVNTKDVIQNDSAFETKVLEAKAKIGTEYFETVQAAVDSVVGTDATIELLPVTIDEDVKIYQTENENITIKGSEGTIYKGSFYIDGKSRGTAKETLVFDGITFIDTEATEGKSFIYNNKKNESGGYSQPHNITVKNCNFTGTDVAGVDVVGVTMTQYWGFEMINCKGQNLHSMLQATALNAERTGLIDTCTVTNCKEGGFALGTQARYTINNTVIDAAGYGIRFDVDGFPADIDIDNCTIEAAIPFVIRRDAANVSKVDVNNSTILATGDNGIIQRLDQNKNPITDEQASKEYSKNIKITANSNYWGGSEPTIKGIDIVLDTYYTDEEKTNEVYSSNVIALVEKTDGSSVVCHSFDAALAVASDGDVVDLIGGEVKLDAVTNINADITIKNGTLDISKVKTTGEGIFNLDGTRAENTHLTFDNITLVGDGYGAGNSAVFRLFDNSTLTVLNSNIDLKNGNSQTIFRSDNKGVKVKISDSTIALDKTERTFVNVELDMDNTTITAKNIKKHIFRNVSGTVDDSAITVDGAEYGMEQGAGVAPLTFTNSRFSVKNTVNDHGNNGIYLSEAGQLVKGEKAVIDATMYIEPKVDEDGNKVFAERIKLTYEPTESQNIYNIYVESVDGNVINRLSAIQLKFKLESDTNMSYTLAPVKGVSLTNAIDEAGKDTKVEDVYVFNFTGENGVADMTGAKIQIGTVTFGGYGKFDFKVVASEGNYTAKAKTAEATDNIIAEYVPVVENAKQGLFDLDASALTGAEVVEVRRDVVVNIAFNNNLKDSAANIADYNQMKVTLTGSNGKTYESEVCFDGANVTSYTNEQATLTFSVEANTRYTVTVSGAGYRTVRYTTLVDEADEALELNFWNNALENADRTARTEEIEAGVARSAKSVTFLAGDISPDNTIDKYDLAAVVSYFGYDNLKSDAKYYGFAKYDLNRDGQIDADDIATVLISWGK